MSVDIDVTEDNITWLGLLSAIIAALALSFSSCHRINANDNAAMLEMVQAGATAQEARCAVKDANSTFCTVLAVK